MGKIRNGDGTNVLDNQLFIGRKGYARSIRLNLSVQYTWKQGFVGQCGVVGTHMYTYGDGTVHASSTTQTGYFKINGAKPVQLDHGKGRPFQVGFEYNNLLDQLTVGLVARGHSTLGHTDSAGQQVTLMLLGQI